MYADLEPGDAIFFHCETMHQSGPNTSGLEGKDQPPRWAFLVAYDPSHNATNRLPHPARPDSPIWENTGSSPVLDDELVLEYGRVHLEAARSHLKAATCKAKRSEMGGRGGAARL